MRHSRDLTRFLPDTRYPCILIKDNTASLGALHLLHTRHSITGVSQILIRRPSTHLEGEGRLLRHGDDDGVEPPADEPLRVGLTAPRHLARWALVGIEQLGGRAQCVALVVVRDTCSWCNTKRS